jgi:GntR family transcriptional regulator
MDFRKPRTIAAQISDHICDRILQGVWQSEERLPSVRDMAGLLQVNPNTIMRVYSELQQAGVLHCRRGIGIFVSPDASGMIRRQRRERFVAEELPDLFRTLDALGIEVGELEALYREHRPSPSSRESLCR